uniref:Sarcosine dehydrogenase, mitochondrial n=1 Tax=Photinus pyralis TaxID=7054 RepID=A0A1Y1MDL9_PHOPY
MLRVAARIVSNNRNGLSPFVDRCQCYSSEINLPSQADVVIIGGGSIGCNTLYQLSKKGVKAVLLERNKITSGTTWHTGGIVWRLGTNDVDIQLLAATRNQLLKLEEETGCNSGFVNTGSLFLARNKERLKEYKRMHTIGYYFGVESQLLSASDAAKIHPLLNPKSFVGALHSPGDGVVDSTILCNALTKGAINNGAQVIENCAVTNVKVDSTSGYKKVVGVETQHGVIKTNCVLNAAGAWSRNIAQMVGLDIPLLPIQHAYVVTEGIPGAKGAPNIRDKDVSIYYRSQGDSLYIGGYETNPHIIKDLPNDFAFGLYELDFGLFGVHMEKAYDLMPAVKDVGIKTNICGPESFTPDHKPLLGEDPKLRGFYYACGLNSAGMMFGPGIAEQMAHWIVNGRPELPMFNYDIRRFTPEMKNDRAWVTEKCHEAYATHHGIGFKHTQPLAGRNFKIDVFHEILVANGAVMEQSQGWEVPGFYIKDSTAPVRVYDWHGFYDHVDNPDKRYEKQLEGDCTFEFSKHHDLIGHEALAARTNAALFNTSYCCKLYLTGPDARKAADWLFTAHTDQELEKIVYTCALNKNGGTEGDATVIGLNQGLGTLVGPILKGRGYYIVANGLSGYHMLTHIKREIQKKQFRATVTDVTDNLGILSIQGPKSREILQAITESPITNEKLPYGMSDIITVNGHTCRILRISFVGELGYELHIPYSSCIPVYNKLADAGRSFDMKLAGYRARYSLHCEKGHHLWNKDLRLDDNPVEANLHKLCRNEGCYLGKDHVDRLKKEGVDKVRAFFTIKDKIPLWGYETIWRDDQIVGYLRRAEYGYYLKSSIGTGYIRHPKNKKVTEEYLSKGQYEIEVMGKRYPATLHLKSPFDPKHQRVAGHYEHQFVEEVNFED